MENDWQDHVKMCVKNVRIGVFLVRIFPDSD